MEHIYIKEWNANQVNVTFYLWFKLIAPSQVWSYFNCETDLVTYWLIPRISMPHHLFTEFWVRQHSFLITLQTSQVENERIVSIDLNKSLAV